MSDKTKQRIRARMARTGESYQGVVNALRGPGNGVVPAARPLVLVCDLCGQDLLDDPLVAMVQWVYEREPPFRDVAGLFFVHKGACDQLIKNVSWRMKLSDSWMDLADFIAGDWYEESRELRESKNWCTDHEERLDRFFRDVARARESGWRPRLGPIMNLSDPTMRQTFDRDRDAFEAKSVARWQAFQQDSTLIERVRNLFAPEWLERPAPSDVATGDDVTCEDALVATVPTILAAPED